MEESKKDFANNPFVALFKNIDTAKSYAEGTKCGLEAIQLSHPEVTNEKDDDDGDVIMEQVTGEEEHASFLSKSTSKFKKEILVNDFLQRIFLITIDCDEENSGILQFGGLPYTSVKLIELKEECEENSKPCLLSGLI